MVTIQGVPGIIGSKKRQKMSMYEGSLSTHDPANTLVLELWLKNHMRMLVAFFFQQLEKSSKVDPGLS